MTDILQTAFRVVYLQSGSTRAEHSTFATISQANEFKERLQARYAYCVRVSHIETALVSPWLFR